MEKLGEYKDEFYPFSYIDHSRVVARAIIINDKNEILLEKITRDDIFGDATYYETPGGGVNSQEDLKLAVKREVEEECGLVIDVLDEIGYVEDDYNLIHRHNISNYYLAKTVGKCDFRREEYETHWIKSLDYIELNQAIEILSNPKNQISKIVYRREIVVLKKVKEMLGI